MRFVVWGARGSIAVSGPEHVRYGGDTTCAQLETDSGETVILDAGTGLRALGNRLVAEGRREFHFLLSHAHWDHLMGFPFFKPLYRSDCVVHFHGCTIAQQSIRSILSETMRPPFFPVSLTQVAARLEFDRDCRESFEFAGVRCNSIPLSHPDRGYGFRLEHNARSVAFFPDNEPLFAHPGGRSFGEYAAFLAGADLVVHDAEYLPSEYESTTRGWGHSVFLDTVRLGLEARVGRLVLWHLNQDRDDDGQDALQRAAREAAGGAAMACDLARTGAAWDL